MQRVASLPIWAHLEGCSRALALPGALVSPGTAPWALPPDVTQHRKDAA